MGFSLQMQVNVVLLETNLPAMQQYNPSKALRILATFEAKIVKICNFWTFEPVIPLITHLFEI